MSAVDWQPPRWDVFKAERCAQLVGRVVADLKDLADYLTYYENGACDDPPTQALNDLSSAIPELEAAQRWLRGELTPTESDGPAPRILGRLRGPGQTGEE